MGGPTLLMGLIMLSIPSLILCRMLMVFSPKDAPDADRKTQKIAVPTSGGLAFAFAALSWLAIIYGNDSVLNSECVNVEAFACLPASQRYLAHDIWPHILLFLGALFLGAIDDRFTLPAKPKFVILAGLVLFATGLGANIDGIFFPVADAYFPIAAWLGITGTALWLFVVMNATNFMDGSNGLAMGTLAIMLGSISIHFYGHGHFHDLSVIGALTVASILGFLFWNLQGKLYAGDAGSLFGGAVFASLGIYAAQDGNIWFPATLALPFLVDVFMTLLWRARAGHNLLTPHRHHAYQLFIRAGWGHLKTALLWWALAAICAVAGLWAAGDSKSTSAWVFFGLLGAGCALWLWQRRVYGPRASA